MALTGRTVRIAEKAVFQKPEGERLSDCALTALTAPRPLCLAAETVMAPLNRTGMWRN